MDATRQLQHRYQVRLDEADAQARLRPSGFLRFAQDIAWRHSEVAGFGREWYAERGLQWLVRNVTLHIVAPVTYGDTLVLATEVTSWRHVWARRHAEMRRAAAGGLAGDGELVALVDTDFVLIRLDGRPSRLPPEITAWFSAPQTFERSRVRLPETPAEPTRLVTRVRPLDVDPMGHMNNAAYLDVVEETVLRMPSDRADWAPFDGSAGRLYRVGYARPAQPGSQLEVTCWSADSVTVACRICDGEGEELSRVLISRLAS